MDIHNPRHREIFAHRIIAKMPTIAAAAYKHSLGQPFVYPRNDLDYCANMLHMFFAVPCEPYNVDPVAAEALDLLFILHADHEQNASTSTVRLAGSTGAESVRGDLRRRVGAVGPGARRRQRGRARRCSSRSAPSSNIPKYLAMAKDKSSHFRLMGFGHRVYKNFDPRAKIIREMCHKVLAEARPARTIRCSSSRCGSRRSRSRTSTSSRASSIRTSTSTPASSTRALGIPTLDVHGDVRDRAHRRLGRALAGDDLAIPRCASAGRASSYTGRGKRDYVPVSKR